MPSFLMASQPNSRCRYYVRLQDVPATVRLRAVGEAARTWPEDVGSLFAAAVYPDPDHGEWVAESLSDLLERQGVAA